MRWLYLLLIPLTLGCGARSPIDPGVRPEDGSDAAVMDGGLVEGGVRDAGTRDTSVPIVGECEVVGTTTVHGATEQLTLPTLSRLGRDILLVFTATPFEGPAGFRPRLRALPLSPTGDPSGEARTLTAGRGGTLAAIEALGAHVLFAHGESELLTMLIDRNGDMLDEPGLLDVSSDELRPALAISLNAFVLAWTTGRNGFALVGQPEADEPIPHRIPGHGPWAALSRRSTSLLRLSTIDGGNVWEHRLMVGDEAVDSVLQLSFATLVTAARVVEEATDRAVVAISPSIRSEEGTEVSLVRESIQSHELSGRPIDLGAAWDERSDWLATVVSHVVGDQSHLTFIAQRGDVAALLELPVAPELTDLPRPALIDTGIPGSFLAVWDETFPEEEARLQAAIIECPTAP